MSVITAVIATYNMEQYLPDFLASLDGQTNSLIDVDLIFVNDGSTDGSARLIDEWISKGHATARQLHQRNAGAASARNAGTKVATSKWITYPDPDDVFAPEYFQVLISFLTSRQGKKCHLVSTNQIYLDEETGELRDRHPLRGKFARGDQVINLARHPEYIHLSGGTGVFRLGAIRENRLQLDPEIRPGFEDAYFTSLYLSRFGEPIIGVLATAHYHYRRRLDKSSATQSGWHSEEKYTHLLEKGHLRLLQTVSKDRGEVPVWIQNVILYDLFFYFREDGRAQSVTAWIPHNIADRFRYLVRQIMEFIDESTVRGFSITHTVEEIKNALVIGGKGMAERPRRVEVMGADGGRQLVKLRYLYGGVAPKEELFARGILVHPVHAKTRDVAYLGTTWMHERILWVPADGTIMLRLDGEFMDIQFGTNSQNYRLLPAQLRRRYSALQSQPPPTGPREGRARTPLRQRWTRLMGRSWLAARYAEAWVLMDRDTTANDNAEHLYRYLHEHRPDINAWFALSPKSRDWSRLQAEGFKLLPHGSARHIAALMNARHLISSQADNYVMNPWPGRTYGDKDWRFTFLQHGVTKDDLSRWMNGKDMSLFVTATPAEWESIAGSGNNYSFTSREVKLTGFPRHDSLGRKAESLSTGQRTLVLVMPTWRRNLMADQVANGNLRHLNEAFWSSDYFLLWRRFLGSATLHEAAEQHSAEIAFVAHPNLQTYIGQDDMPSGVRLYTYDDEDVQMLLARAKVLVTDYSSLAFEAAYLERPVVYFQFDQARFFDGSHAYRKGYWDYVSEGFGPVATSVDEATAQVVKIIQRDGRPSSEYAQRIRDAFAYRDGRACERVVAEIEGLSQPGTYEQRYRKVGP